MLHFHISIHPRDNVGASTWEVTFDRVLEELSRLDRLFIEPDGSFVWTGSQPEGTVWQADGNLIDRGDFLAYMELKGHCPEAQFNQIMKTLGWPDVPLAFELTRRGIVVEEAEFRQLAATQAGAV